MYDLPDPPIVPTLRVGTQPGTLSVKRQSAQSASGEGSHAERGNHGGMGMSYPAYPEYKDSGVEWVNEIPIHWGVRPFKFMARIKNGKDYKDVEVGEPGFPVIGSGGQFAYASKYLFKGESVLLGRKGTIDKPLYINGSFWTVDTMFYTEINRNTFPKYLYNCALTIKFDYFSTNTAVPSMTQEDLGNIVFPCPDIKEQTQIATFLDRETQKIDRLIEKQQQLIKLLQEKRQAVISHAVTKGLNPDAKMKDSGVEWLGEIPEYWEMVPIKYLCSFSGGGTPSKENLSYWVGGDVPWVSPKDMKSFWISNTKDKLTVKAVEESSTNFVESGALLMVVRSGILQRTIPIAINTVKVTLNQDMKALRFNRRMRVEYAANFILGYVPSLLLEWSKEGATVESIEQEYLSASLFPVPPIKEQIEIEIFLKYETKKIDQLIEKCNKAIRLSKERRTALISAAVTGKIDVRHIVNG